MAVTPSNNTNNAPAVRPAARPTRGSNKGAGEDWEKADAFINIAVPTAVGQRVRLEAIKLYNSNPVHAQLIAKLTAPELTPEQKAEKLEALKQLMIFEFNLPLTDEQKVLVDF